MTSTCKHVFPCVVKCSMRFSSMTEEWLLLRMHLLWSGGGVIVLSTLSWWKIGLIQKRFGRERWQKIAGQRRRLLRIAFLTSVSLLVSLVITVLTVAVLEDWNRSSDVWLTCTLYERFSHNWDAYGFENGEEVCSSDASWTPYLAGMHAFRHACSPAKVWC
jgi:hypothetical protein